MRVMAGRALLRSGMRGDHDLTLLRGPARHLFVAKGAQLLRIGGNGKLAAGGVERDRCAPFEQRQQVTADLIRDRQDLREEQPLGSHFEQRSEALLQLLAPLPDDWLSAQPVGKLVNNPSGLTSR